MGTEDGLDLGGGTGDADRWRVPLPASRHVTLDRQRERRAIEMELWYDVAVAVAGTESKMKHTAPERMANAALEAFRQAFPQDE